MLLCLILLTTLLASQAHGSKAQCVKQLTQWCNNIHYANMGTSLLSESFADENGSHQVSCISNKSGTKCTKNGSPWFTCTPDHKFIYKGRVLASTSGDVDNQICKAAATIDKIFNPFDSSAMDKGFKKLFDEMAGMEDRMKDGMDEFEKKMEESMNKDFWPGFPFKK